MARALGERLGSRLGTVRASPILRCRQTAQALMEGAGQAGDVPVDRRLGDPGVFIADPEVAGGTWERLGYGAVMEALSRGEQLPGFQHPGRASEELFNWMAELARAAPGVNVLITHDSVVWPVACWLSGWSAAQRWPGWLEGIALWREAGHTLTARGEELIRR